MKKWMMLVLLLVPVKVFAQALWVQGKGYRGYMLDTTLSQHWGVEGMHSRYVLHKEEVKQAEQILKDLLPTIYTQRFPRKSGCPDINRKLHKYYRQYFGFKDKHGNTIVFISMVYGKEAFKGGEQGLIMAMDGCTHYWKADINITQRTLRHLDVNGPLGSFHM